MTAERAISIIERPALYALLDVGSGTQFTVVTAPAGSGKTVLVRTWLENQHPTHPYSWVSVDRGERDPQRFWRNVVTEVSRTAALDSPFDDLAAAPEFRAELVISRLLATLGDLENLTIVVDDVHEIKSSDILSQLSTFLDQVPHHIRLVLISRHDLQLGLHRRRLEGELSEVRIDQLRFSVDESKQLLAAAGITLSDSSLQLLHRRTEGWAAGLRLAAVSIATHPDPERFVLEFSGSERTVAEYLMAEVLMSLPPDVRRLLVNTSVLDRVNGDLGDLLTGDVGTERHLRDLAESGGFVIPLDARGEWYRFHHLFADLLITELRHTQSHEIPSLHLAAAQWLSKHGYVLEAISHALEADNGDLVGSLLVEHYFSLMLDGRQVTVRSLVDTAIGRSATAELAAVAAADELISGSLDRATAQMRLAEQRADEVPEDRRQRFDMMLYVTKLSLSRRIGDFESALDTPQPASLSEQPLTSTDIALQSDVQSLLLMNLGIIEVWSGRLADGERHLAEAEGMARQIGRPYLEASCLAYRAQAVSWRSFSKARPLATEAFATAERHGLGDDPVAGAALIVLGSCLVSHGRIEAAADAFARADERLRPHLYPAIGFVLHTGHGVVNLVRANYPEAIECFQEAERLGAILVTNSPLALQARCAMLYAATLGGESEFVQAALDQFTEAERNSGEVRDVLALRSLAEGDAVTALAVIEPTVTETIGVHHRMVLIRALLHSARAHEMLNDEIAAQESIERALGLAEEDQLVLPFFWVDTARLLKRHFRHQTAHGEFVTEILTALSGGEPVRGAKPAQSLVGALSDTELRVLRLLPTNLTAAEIGSEIYVSVNTVKTHMRNIYMKLDAHSRSQAVEFARDLGLLSHSVPAH